MVAVPIFQIRGNSGNPFGLPLFFERWRLRTERKEQRASGNQDTAEDCVFQVLYLNSLKQSCGAKRQQNEASHEQQISSHNQSPVDT